jgi:hypothetical protein
MILIRYMQTRLNDESNLPCLEFLLTFVFAARFSAFQYRHAVRVRRKRLGRMLMHESLTTNGTHPCVVSF